MTDTRLEEDIPTSELPKFLKTTPKYDYAFHDGSHSLRLRGLMRYIRFNHSDRDSKLCQLQYATEELTSLQIDHALKDYMMGFSLPYSVTDAVHKYNWLIGAHCRNVDYRDEISSLVIAQPALLNYNYSDAKFCNIFQITRDNIRVSVFGTNIFDNEPELNLIFCKTQDVAEVERLLKIHPYSCSHISWHLHNHIFVYPDRSSMLNKILSSIVQDSKLYQQQLTYSAPRGSRPTERMITYCADEAMKRIMAIAPLTLDSITEGKLSLMDVYSHLRDVADALFAFGRHQHPQSGVLAVSLKTTEALRVLYLKMYNNPHIFYMPPIQYTRCNTNMWPYIDVVPMTLNLKLISSIANQPVVWRSPVKRLDVFHFPVRDAPSVISAIEISTSLIDLQLIPKPLYSICTLFQSVSYAGRHRANPTGMTNAPSAMKAALRRYQTEDSIAQTYLNNIQPNTLNLDFFLSSLFQRFSSGQERVFRGSLQHLCLSMYLSSGLITGSQMSVGKDFKIRRHNNNSLAKMISCYVYLARTGYDETDNLDDDGLPSYLLPDRPRVVFLGAELEPAMDVLQTFYGHGNIVITGYGNRGVGKQRVRLDINDAVSTNFKTDYLISDINQTNYDADEPCNFQEMCDLCVRLALIAVGNSKQSLIKINNPTQYLINHIMTEVAAKYPDRTPHFRIVKFAAQKAFGHEVYLYIESDSALANNFFSLIAPFRSYNELFVLSKVEPLVLSQISNVLAYNVPRLYRFLVAREDVTLVLQAAHNMSISCHDFTTRTTSGDIQTGVGKAIAFSGRVDDARIALMQRFKVFDDAGLPRSAVITHGFVKILPSVPYLTDLVHAFPNGFGALAPNDKDELRQVRNLGSIMRQCCYKLVESRIQLSFNDSLKHIIVVGGRDLSELSCVRRLPKVPITVYDPAGIDEKIYDFGISYSNAKYEFYQNNPYENTLVLALFVIMTDPEGHPLSIEQQRETITTLHGSLASGCIAFVQIYVDYAAIDVIDSSDNSVFYTRRYPNDSRAYITVGDYQKVAMWTVGEIGELTHSLRGVTACYPSFKTFLSVCQDQCFLMNGIGVAFRDVAIHSFCVLEIRIE